MFVSPGNHWPKVWFKGPRPSLVVLSERSLSKIPAVTVELLWGFSSRILLTFASFCGVLILSKYMFIIDMTLW